MDLIREVTQQYLKTDIPQFKGGDTVKATFDSKKGRRKGSKFLKVW